MVGAGPEEAVRLRSELARARKAQQDAEAALAKVVTAHAAASEARERLAETQLEEPSSLQGRVEQQQRQMRDDEAVTAALQREVVDILWTWVHVTRDDPPGTFPSLFLEIAEGNSSRKKDRNVEPPR